MSSGLPFDPLDPQREQVYAAELATFPREADKFLSLEELQAAADELLALPWFRRRFPEVKRMAVKDGRGSKWSRSVGGSVHLRRVSRVKDVLYHEAVHEVIPAGVEWHGPVFCGMLLYFIGKLYGQAVKDRLRREFRRQDPPVLWDRRIARFGDLNRNGSENDA